MKSCSDLSFLLVEARRYHLPLNAAHIPEKLTWLITKQQSSMFPLVLQPEV